MHLFYVYSFSSNKLFTYSPSYFCIILTAFYTEKLQTVPTGPKYGAHAVGVQGV